MQKLESNWQIWCQRSSSSSSSYSLSGYLLLDIGLSLHLSIYLYFEFYQANRNRHIFDPSGFWSTPTSLSKLGAPMLDNSVPAFIFHQHHLVWPANFYFNIVTLLTKSVTCVLAWIQVLVILFLRVMCYLPCRSPTIR